MTKDSENRQRIKAEILKDPHAILNDQEVLRALIMANNYSTDSNIIDLKTVALKELEKRFTSATSQTKTIVSAAYSNLTATALIHQAILNLLTPNSFAQFIDFLSDNWAMSLHIKKAVLILESPSITVDKLPMLRKQYGTGIVFSPSGTINRYCPKPVILRATHKPTQDIYGAAASQIKSEALLQLSLGVGKQSGLLILGSTNIDQFTPDLRTDLLLFYGSVFEKTLQRWLNDDA